uniref:Uncharacterized protein n=1 Tax=Glossina palpalis gambiensis TaxID=67801 RepID=A0A1B0AV54_9MUSC
MEVRVIGRQTEKQKRMQPKLSQMKNTNNIRNKEERLLVTPHHDFVHTYACNISSGHISFSARLGVLAIITPPDVDHENKHKL